jgi:hypothetical protein
MVRILIAPICIDGSDEKAVVLLGAGAESFVILPVVLLAGLTDFFNLFTNMEKKVRTLQSGPLAISPWPSYLELGDHRWHLCGIQRECILVDKAEPTGDHHGLIGEHRMIRGRDTANRSPQMQTAS